MQERIQKIISAAGIASRRAAEELILEGRVRVNGKAVTELGSKADPEKDHIKVDGKLINPRQPKTYLMLNKPAGYVTTMSDPEGRPTVQDLLKGVKVRVYPVGRLDYNTEGMLILTNDGDFAHLVTHPKHELPKTYLAKLKGILDDKAIDSLEKGVFLEDGKTAPARLKKIRKEEANSWVEITIHEGRKRQVRRMFDRVGRSVIKLKRIKTGSLVLGELPEGAFRHLAPAEVQGLREMAQNPGMKIQKPEIKRPRVDDRTQKTESTAPKPSRSLRKPRQDDDRVKGPGSRVMLNTRDGRRRNQGSKPGARSAFPGERKPGRGMRDEGSGGRRGSYRQREDRSYRPAISATTRSSTSKTSTGRLTKGPGAWKSDARRKPEQRSWSSSRSGGSKKSGFGRGPQGEGQRPGTGPRPDRSTHRGSNGPGRRTKFGSRGGDAKSKT